MIDVLDAVMGVLEIFSGAFNLERTISRATAAFFAAFLLGIILFGSIAYLLLW